MSLNGKMTPLNLNTMGSLLGNQGFRINPQAEQFMGTSNSASNYAPGAVVTNTVLYDLVLSINIAYTKIGSNSGTHVTQATYDNLISIGSNTIPALGNSKPSTYEITYTGEDTRFGFLRLIPLLAHVEFHVNGGSSYSDFLSTFNACEAFKNQHNQMIQSFATARTFMDGSYSNMNDLITSDITGVSLATFVWGQDLINTGRVIDLSRIEDFGLPSVLLRTLQKNSAVTKGVALAMLSAGLTSAESDKLVSGQVATFEQEKKLYSAFNLIAGQDLTDVCIPVNCQTKGLDTLADLLDPKKLFPSSYETLTVARYNTTSNPTNSKAYFLLYKGQAPNIVPSLGYGSRLRNILPDPIAYVCEAFSSSMQQIKNIRNVKIEKFSQVVTNLENVYTLPTGATSIPTNSSAILTGITALSKGIGPDGTYTTCDFFGAMSGLSYQWQLLYQAILHVQTTNLATIYKDMYTLLSGAGPFTTLSADLQLLIDSANIEIKNILDTNGDFAKALNSLYNTFGILLSKEQIARAEALGNLADWTSSSSDVFVFMQNLTQYANETQDYGASRVLEAIAHRTSMGGNSLIGSMREIRNSLRLGLAGLALDNSVVPQVIPRPVTSVSKGYSNTGLATKITINTGAAIPGSLAGSPEISLIPSNLSIVNIPSTVLTPAEAIHEVTLCNCDCWDNL